MIYGITYDMINYILYMVRYTIYDMIYGITYDMINYIRYMIR